MKNQPLPKSLPEIGWAINPQKSLSENLGEAYKALSEGKGNQASGRSREEATFLLAQLTSPQGDLLCKGTEALKQEDLLAKKLSLWAETPSVSEIGTELAEAAVEIETQFLLQKDVVQCEIHRRNLAK